jgi:hypothetical protein
MPEDETVQSEKPLLELEDDLYEDLGNSSNYQCERKQVTTFSPPDID